MANWRPGPSVLAAGWVLTLLAATGHATEPEAPSAETAAAAVVEPEIGAQIDTLFKSGMEAIYRGQPTEADRIATEMLRLAPEDPRPYLFKARVLRLDVPDQNDEHEGIKGRVAPILSVLDKASDAADAIIRRDLTSKEGHLYRGWALMFKAQLLALSGEYWGAGQRAKAGKKELDLVLEQEPGNADALLIQGVYLYFADVLPATVKLARFFVGIPGGHRIRGLEYIEASSRRPGYNQLDARAIFGVVLFGFEGRFEDAIVGLQDIESAYPNNIRMHEPIALMHLFLPDRLGQGLPITESIVQANAASSEPWERKVAARTRYYMALGQMLDGQLNVARDNLDLLRRERPEDPDWLGGDVLKALVDIDLMLGEQSQAAQLIAPLRPDDRKRRNLAYALQSSSGSSPAEARALTELQPLLRGLYAGDTAPAARALADLGGLNAAFVEFYLGEAEFIQGRFDAALQHYQKLIGADMPPRYDWFRNLAYLRAAEVQGRRGHDSEAAQVLGDFLDQYDTRDLLRHVVKARRRYYENGKPTTPALARANGARPASTNSPDSH